MAVNVTKDALRKKSDKLHELLHRAVGTNQSNHTNYENEVLLLRKGNVLE